MRWLRDILRALAAEDRAVLISSHVLSEVEQTVDEVVVIGAGRLVTQGSLEQILAGDERPARVRCPRPVELAAALEAAGGHVAEDGADGLVVRHLTLEQIGDTAAGHGLALHELTWEAQTLEGRFLELTGEGGNVR
jgi:ABC-2 type transport system ATP-binding protein